MDEAPVQSSATIDKSALVALIVIARYLNSSDPGFADFLTQSYQHAEAAGLAMADLEGLRIIAGAIGRVF